MRNNIIPDEVELIGTIRNFDKQNQDAIHASLKKMASTIAEASGATAEVTTTYGYPVTINNPELTAKMLPTVKRVAGEDKVARAPLVMGAEDFSYLAQETPGLFPVSRCYSARARRRIGAVQSFAAVLRR